MNIQLNKTIPISIKDQIKRQIRGIIQEKQILPGSALPSSKDLASILAVNRNTVAAAYQELISEGLLTSIRGKGTFISKNVSIQFSAELAFIMKEAVSKAFAKGFSSAEITDHFFSTLTDNSTIKQQILVVWCNKFTLREVSQALEEKLAVKTECVGLEVFKSDPQKAATYLEGKDLVVTSINYLESIRPVTEKYGIEVAGVMLMSVTRVINEIIKLPDGITIGFSCINDVAAESTCKFVRLSGGTTLKTIWAGADDLQNLKEMISLCDVIFATHYVYEKVRQLTPPKIDVISIDCKISDANINLIQEQLLNNKS